MDKYPSAESNKPLQSIISEREGVELCAASVKLFANNQTQTTPLELFSLIEAAYNRGCK